MSRASFHLLLEKYQQGTCTPEERQIVERWYEMLDEQDLDANSGELVAVEEKLWDKIKNEITPEHQEKSLPVAKKLSLPKILSLMAAAISAILLISSIFLLYKEDKKPHFQAQNKIKTLIEKTNLTNSPLVVLLEDGSSVTLEPSASLKYPTHFAASVREVRLEGNGFFLISKNPSRPFLVYNKNIITRVVGTSFTIKTNPKNETEVTVKTGKVIVSSNEEKKKFAVKDLFGKDEQVVLVPNQKTIYHAQTESFTTTLADDPIPVEVKGLKKAVKLNYHFIETPVPEVLDRLRTSYGIEIQVEDAALNNNTFTGDLSEQSLYNKIDFLCQSINASYQLSGTTIVIRKK